MDYIVLVGLMAASLTTVSWIPEVVKVWKTKSTRDLSSLWLEVSFAGLLLWLLYGFLISSFPLIASNVVTGLLVGILLFFKLRYGKGR